MSLPFEDLGSSTCAVKSVISATEFVLQESVERLGPQFLLKRHILYHVALADKTKILLTHL